jgi:hypothetical protein
MVVKEGDTLTLRAPHFHHHPGHTPPAEFTVYDNDVPRKALWQGGGGCRADPPPNRLAQLAGPPRRLSQRRRAGALRCSPSAGPGILTLSSIVRQGRSSPRAQANGARNVEQEKRIAAAR